MSHSQQPPGEQPTAPAVDGLGDGVIATDERGRITTMNDAAQRMLGWTLQEAQGQALDNVFRVADPESRQAIPSRIGEVLRENRIVGRPIHPVLMARDGTSGGAVTDSIAPIRDGAGTIRGAIVVFRDQDRDRAHAEALEASEARISAILEWSLDAVITTDESGRILDFNPAAERMFGHDRDAARGALFRDLVIADPGLWQRRADATRAQGERTEIEARRADGTVFPADIVIVRVPAATGVSYTCFLRDLTEPRRARDALTQSQAQLRALAGRVQAATEEERTRIARELHDELGQQLTAIRMDLGWLLRRPQSDEVAERLRAISALVDTTFKVVRRLGTELRPGILDDLGLAAAIEWQAREFSSRSGIDVQFTTEGDLSSLDPAAATSVFRIFQEILTNVGRHSGAKNVNAVLSRQGGELRFEVADDGRGIRPEEAANLNSLGLLGMRERATLLGGTLRVEAAPSRGTVVTVTLPSPEGS
jgi:PAS domain S-box-containing protein